MQLIHSVYFLLMIGLFGSLLHIVNLIYTDDKKKLWYVILFPPYLFYYAIINRHSTKNSLILAALFLIIITFVGFIGGQPYGLEAVIILYKVFLWPVFLIIILLNNNGLSAL